MHLHLRLHFEQQAHILEGVDDDPDGILEEAFNDVVEVSVGHLVGILVFAWVANEPLHQAGAISERESVGDSAAQLALIRNEEHQVLDLAVVHDAQELDEAAGHFLCSELIQPLEAQLVRSALVTPCEQGLVLKDWEFPLEQVG